jgi:hypothetical protein
VQGLLTRDVLDFAVVVSAGALLLLTHWAVARRLFGDPMISRPLRWLALLPPFTPFVAFYEGKRAASYLYIVVVAGYVTARWTTA